MFKKSLLITFVLTGIAFSAMPSYGFQIARPSTREQPPKDWRQQAKKLIGQLRDILELGDPVNDADKKKFEVLVDIFRVRLAINPSLTYLLDTAQALLYNVKTGNLDIAKLTLDWLEQALDDSY